MLQKQHRLTKRKEFSYIYKNGQATHSNMLTIVMVKSKKETPKVGFSVSNKLGNAPVRNKIKRRLREILRQKLTIIKPYQNLIIVAKQPIVEASFSDTQKEMCYILNKGNLIKQ